MSPALSDTFDRSSFERGTCAERAALCAELERVLESRLRSAADTVAEWSTLLQELRRLGHSPITDDDEPPRALTQRRLFLSKGVDEDDGVSVQANYTALLPCPACGVELRYGEQIVIHAPSDGSVHSPSATVEIRLPRREVVRMRMGGVRTGPWSEFRLTTMVCPSCHGIWLDG